jgi:hypothetical protein
MHMIATMLPASALLPTLYALRDEQLAGSAEGRELTTLYYRHSAEAKEILLDRPESLVRALRLAASLAAARKPTPQILDGGVALAREIAAHGTESLRQAVESAVSLSRSPAIAPCVARQAIQKRRWLGVKQLLLCAPGGRWRA